MAVSYDGFSYIAYSQLAVANAEGTDVEPGCSGNDADYDVGTPYWIDDSHLAFSRIPGEPLTGSCTGETTGPIYTAEVDPTTGTPSGLTKKVPNSTNE